jgi:hypothetical protein
MRRPFVLLVPLVLVLVLAACSSDDDTPKATTSTTAKRSSTTSSTLTSSTSAPGRGATSTTTPAGPSRALTGAGGTGNFTWSVVTDRSEFCYHITLDSHSAATGANLYRGAAGSTGDVVLQLMPPGSDGTVTTCSAGDQLLVQEIRAQPAQFYVLVTTSKGTSRGQLA